MNSLDIDWADVINKDARGMGGYDLGEVQSVKLDHVITKSSIYKHCAACPLLLSIYGALGTTLQLSLDMFL